MSITYILVIIITCVNGDDKVLTNPIVLTKSGPVEGLILHTIERNLKYSAFRGIPYAEPPVGYLRFKPPIEKTPWTETFPATKEGPQCVQKDPYSSTYVGSEDCLIINVYSPQTKFKETDNKELKAVMVWFSEDTYHSGSSAKSDFGPDFFLEDGIVFVSFNYRLGPLGYLNLNHENATGNAALKDQVLALKWIKQNIKNFGGDPNRITIFGQSSGAVSVDLHVLSDMSADLFHRSISMSGSPFSYWAYDDPGTSVFNAFLLGAKLKRATISKIDVLTNLYNASAVDIMKAGHDLGSVTFKPTIERNDTAKNEEKFMTQCPWQKYMSARFNKLPHMTGFTKYETLLYSKDIVNTWNKVKLYFKALRYLCTKIHTSFVVNVIDEIIQMYHELFTASITITSNIWFITGIDLKQKLLNTFGEAPVFYYRFSFDSEYSIHKLRHKVYAKGPTHGDDLSYLFNINDIKLPHDPNCSDNILRKRMIRMWTNFAKYGNPTPDGAKDSLIEITWPASGGLETYIEIGNNLTIGRKPIDDSTYYLELIKSGLLSINYGCSTEPTL